MNNSILQDQVVVERNFNAPIALVWQSITEKDLMKQWYFDVDDFRAEIGFEFQFIGQGLKCENYLHLCKIIEVEPLKKLTHSWTYDGIEGYSTVTFELFAEGENSIRLKLTHIGLETFPVNNPDFVRESFASGWSYLINTALKNFVEPNFASEILLNKDISTCFSAVKSNIAEWWSEDFSGSSEKIGDIFTVRFGSTYKTMKMQSIIHNKQIIWECVDTLIDIPELSQNTEWKDTTINWDFESGAKKTKIIVTHNGLTPKLDCYEVCEKGWDTFLLSLKEFIENKNGNPFKI